MDGPEIERLTSGIAPLTDFFPKRLTDIPADPAEVDRLAMEYMPAAGAQRRYRDSELMKQLWPDLGEEVDPYFTLRATRYLSETRDTNKLAELDTYLRKFSVRAPVLEVLGSDPLRLSIVREVTHATADIPPEALPDLAAGALARHDFEGASLFLETERSLGTADDRDILLLTYVYCLAGHVDQGRDDGGRPEAGSGRSPNELALGQFAGRVWVQATGRISYNWERKGSMSHSVVRSQSERFLNWASVSSRERARSFRKDASIWLPKPSS